MGINRYKAQPISNNDVRGLASQLRKILGYKDDERIDIVRVLEFAFPRLINDFNYSIREETEMAVKDVLAYTDQDNNEIVIREDAYQNAVNGLGRDRFTIAHEIWHFLIHNNRAMVMTKTFTGETLKAYEDPEWQADALAGEFLCPARATKKLALDEIANKFGVSLDAAEIQRKKGVKLNG